MKTVRNLFIVALAVGMLTGCSTGRYAQEKALLAETRKSFDIQEKLRVHGIQDSYDYSQSQFSKTGDVDGYILDLQTKQKQQADVSEKIYKEAITSLRSEVRACATAKEHRSNIENEVSKCLSQVPRVKRDALWGPVGNRATPYVYKQREKEVIAPIVAELQTIRDEQASDEWTKVVQRLRQQEANQQAAAKRAAKRAYEGSIHSLVE